MTPTETYRSYLEQQYSSVDERYPDWSKEARTLAKLVLLDAILEYSGAMDDEQAKAAISVLGVFPDLGDTMAKVKKSFDNVFDNQSISMEMAAKAFNRVEKSLEQK